MAVWILRTESEGGHTRLQVHLCEAEKLSGAEDQKRVAGCVLHRCVFLSLLLLLLQREQQYGEDREKEGEKHRRMVLGV